MNLKLQILDHIKEVFKEVPEEVNTILSNFDDELTGIGEYHSLLIRRYVNDNAIEQLIIKATKCHQ